MAKGWPNTPKYRQTPNTPEKQHTTTRKFASWVWLFFLPLRPVDLGGSFFKTIFVCCPEVGQTKLQDQAAPRVGFLVSWPAVVCPRGSWP